MNPLLMASIAQSAAQVMAPMAQGMGIDMATPTGAATSGQNVFDFGNWTVSTGSSRADATNTETKPSSFTAGAGIDLNLILIGLVAVVVLKKVMG